jgi:hypothetical protein
MLLGVSDCLFDLSLLERKRLRQHQINGRPYVEEEVVGTEQQRHG